MTNPTKPQTPEEAWQDLLEKDDRTSPAEYPEMALITFDEFTQAIQAAVEAERAWWMRKHSTAQKLATAEGAMSTAEFLQKVVP